MTMPADGSAHLPGLTLAYLGDAVYELHIRRHLILAGGRSVGKLHDAAVGYVRAGGQAAALAALQGSLTPIEEAVAKRGRNAAGRGPRHGDPAEYGQATAFEALVGYLYLTGAAERLQQVLDLATAAAVQA